MIGYLPPKWFENKIPPGSDGSQEFGEMMVVEMIMLGHTTFGDIRKGLRKQGESFRDEDEEPGAMSKPKPVPI